MKSYMKKPIMVTWRDARHPTDQWTTIEELEITDNVIVTYGILVKEDEHNIMIAQSLSPEDDTVTGVFTITKVQVISIEFLGIVEAP